MYSPLAILAAMFQRLDENDTAAIISGFAATAWTRSANPELAEAVTQLRIKLGDTRYQTLAAAGAAMSRAAMASYALEQINRVQSRR